MQLASLRASDMAHGRTVEVTTPGASLFRVRRARCSPRLRYAAEHKLEFYPSGIKFYPSIDALRRDLEGR